MPQTDDILDPLDIARFMVMPGAARALKALAGIPEGALRDASIAQLEAMRDTYAAAPPRHQMPDPLNVIGAGSAAPRKAAPKALAGPGPKTGDPKLKAVQMRLDGKFPHEIAKALKLKLGMVYTAIGEARKAGVQFPDIGRAKAGQTHKNGRYIMSMDDVQDGATMGSITRAAKARSIEPEEYVARRKLALDMALGGRHIRAIMEATKEDRMTLGQWFHVAREAGHPVPYMVDTQFVTATPIPDDEPSPQPTAEVIDLKPHRDPNDPHKGRFILTMDDYQKSGGVGGIDKGAALMDVDVPEYLRRRREAVVLFSRGAGIAEVAQTLQITRKQAENWRGRAQRAGLLDLTRPSPRKKA